MSLPPDPLAERGRFIKQGYREVTNLFPDFERILGSLGLEARTDRPLGRLMRSMEDLASGWEREGDQPVTEDQRQEISFCAGFADLLTKIMAAKETPGFGELRKHLQLLTAEDEFIQHYFTGRDEEAANKVFELYLGSLCLLVGLPIEMDDPQESSGGRNPDILTEFRRRKWGIACKVLHSPNPLGYRNHLIRGAEQIKASAAETGIVSLGLKNLLPANDIWPIDRDPETGNLDYRWFESHDDPSKIATDWFTRAFDPAVIEAYGDRESLVAFLESNRTVPQTLNFLPVVTGCKVRGDRAFTKLNIFRLLEFVPIEQDTYDLLRALNVAANHQAEHAIRADS
jgi:hypothetical protein